MRNTPYLALYTCLLLERSGDDARNASFHAANRAIEQELLQAPPPGLVRYLPLPQGEVAWPAFVVPGAGFPTGTLSVWQDLAAAFDYSYRSRLHHDALRHRRDWFGPPAHPTYVLWYVADPAQATFAEGVVRLDRLCSGGPGPEAFDFRHPYTPDGQPSPPENVRRPDPTPRPGTVRFDPGKSR